MPKPPDHADPVQRLLAVMAALRGEGGCPWDREQTHATLTPYLIEEAYEVVHAIEAGEADALRGELGDLLLQVVFHAEIAREAGEYDFAEIAGALADKLVRRHPHVFSDAKAATAQDVRESWEARKARERGSFLEGVPAGLPALQWATKVGGRSAAAGFDWRATGDIVAKLREEVEEFAEELEALNADAGASARLEAEFGDLLFALTQLARWQGIDSETALRRATRKFISRFAWMEREMHRQGMAHQELSATDWARLWEQAKAQSHTET